jgi:hypothetical protein
VWNKNKKIRDSTVVTATGYGLEGRRSIPDSFKITLSFILLRCIYVGNVNQNIKLVIMSTIVKR